jgi:hypothetical protein
MNNFKSKLNSERYFYLEEAKGVPNILKIMSDNIYDKFINYPENEIEKINNNFRYKIEFNKNELEYSFFEKLIIYITISNDNDESSYYNYSKSNWIENKKIFEKIVINIFILKNNINDLSDIIMHELLHAYEDYQRSLNNVGFNKMNPNKISIETDDLKKIKEKFGDNNKLNTLAYYVYYLLNIERNAYVSQIYSELKKYKLTKNDINREKYKELTFFKTYLVINNYSEQYVNSLNNDELKLFAEYIQHSAIKNLYSVNNNIFKKKLINYFKSESEKTMKKMYKVMVEYLEDDNLMEVFYLSKKKMLNIISYIENKNNL